MNTSSPNAIAQQVEPAPSVQEVEPDNSQWIILYGGTPIATKQELSDLGADAWISPENAERVLSAVWAAKDLFNPEKAIEECIDDEPVFISAIEFLKKEKPDGMDLKLIAESGKTIPEIIIKATAGILLKDKMADHFHYLENGDIVINPQNPPALEDGNELLRRILTVKETGKKIENYSAWTLGMISDLMENYFGDRFDPTMVMEATGTAYNTYSTSLSVFRNCWHNRRPTLTFTHHKEVFFANIEESDKEAVLDLAERLELNVALTRKATSFIRHYGIDALKPEEIQDVPELITKLSVRNANRNFMFYLPTERKWYVYSGSYENIPKIATTIINLDTKALVDDGGVEPIDRWGQEPPAPRGPNRPRRPHSELGRTITVRPIADVPEESVGIPEEVLQMEAGSPTSESAFVGFDVADNNTQEPTVLTGILEVGEPEAHTPEDETPW